MDFLEIVNQNIEYSNDNSVDTRGAVQEEQLKSLLWRYFMSYWNNCCICSSNGGLPPMVKSGILYATQTVVTILCLNNEKGESSCLLDGEIMKLKQIIKKGIVAAVYGRHFTSRDAYVSYMKKLGVRIGENCYITDPIKCELDLTRPWLLEIGDNVCITDNVRILTHDFSYSVISRCSMGTYPSMGKVKIGNNVFVGSHALILPGVNIGDNVVIGAGSVITKDVPNNTVVAGSPAKVISSIEEYATKLKKRADSNLRELLLEYHEVYEKYPPEEIMTEYYGDFMSYDEIAEKYPNYIKHLVVKKEDVKPGYKSYKDMVDSTLKK